MLQEMKSFFFRGEGTPSGLTFALRLFRGSTGHSRSQGHQCPVRGQALGPLLALGGFDSLEFSGMFVAFIMCFGLVLEWEGHRVNIHSLSLHVPSTSWHWEGGRSEGGRAGVTQGVNPCHCRRQYGHGPEVHRTHFHT